jgi:hypothetical protein
MCRWAIDSIRVFSSSVLTIALREDPAESRLLFVAYQEIMTSFTLTVQINEKICTWNVAGLNLLLFHSFTLYSGSEEKQSGRDCQ